MRSIISNISQLVAVPPGPVGGGAFSNPPIIEQAALVIEGGKIAWFGAVADAPSGAFDAKIDAGGGTVVPGLIDCHTHAVFAGSREGEFVRKIGGASYLEILESGGGIRSTMRSVRVASVEQLVAESLPRIGRMMAAGVTTLEIKSGYGLSADSELKMLLAVREVASRVPIEIVPTFLGAHALPPEFEGRPDEYIAAISSDELLGRIAREKLAEFADVFCERGAFTVEQSRRFLAACKSHGLMPKVHAEQLSNSGATRLAVEMDAASADHLEYVDDATIAAMRKSRTIPVLLPGCSFFLHSAAAPARKLIDAGLPVALATDCNPGSAMIESLPLVMSMGCTILRMTPAECLVACTANAAAALRRADRIGAIAVGHEADLLILDVPNLDLWPYRVGVNAVKTVIKKGQVVPIREVLSPNFLSSDCRLDRQE
ncbi:MAG: imidazolonepropionase [Planctomycetia bacterium]|nr:imidazolonepropionase [Planctomycetia bacterium]MCC7314252.1 imidazolonepropionase [Planctomycetota bacterium]OQZ00389.1 MAG: imidazolonepropionase [Planctomycetes bacterium UTPLA1]